MKAKTRPVSAASQTNLVAESIAGLVTGPINIPDALPPAATKPSLFSAFFTVILVKGEASRAISAKLNYRAGC